MISAKIGERLASIRQIRVIMEKMENKNVWDLTFESFIGLVILVNAVFIGVSMDAKDPQATPLFVLEWIFAILFWAELIVKLCAHGWRDTYCGRDACSNIFDVTLIGADTLQLLTLSFFREQGEKLNSSGISASLFRVVRLFRLARILRLLQSSVFKDLLTMIHGMMGGLAALGWAVVLFIIFIYVVALLFRESLGPNPTRVSDERIGPYFQTVPRAMFTIFRCSFGDCSTSGGTPLFEHVIEVYGWFWSFAYCCFVFMVVIGLFNVISAIFVENTMASASEIASRKRRELLGDQERWATNVAELLQALLNESHPDLPELNGLEEDQCDELLCEIQQAEFSKESLHRIVRNNPKIQEALRKLDIDMIEHAFLPDILDPQNDGYITVLELVDGLKRLRGEPRRSDIITIDLMVRSLQERIDDIWKWTHYSLKESMDRTSTLKRAGAKGVSLKRF